MTIPLIRAARRLAVVPRGGGFRRLAIHELAAPVIRALLAETGLAPEAVDEVILANALGGGGNPARLAALAAGLPERVGGLTIDRQCCGGLDAALLAVALVRAGAAEVVIAGGAESYSRRPIRMRVDPEGGEPVAYDQPPFTPWPERDPGMAEAAGALAERLGITREEQEIWAVGSHTRALAAAPRLTREIVPLAEITGDPFARPMTPRAAARAPLTAGGMTAATSAVAADGAAFCLVVSERVARRLPGPALGLVSAVTLGADPELPGLAPVPAIRAVLEAPGITPGDLAAVELMEAYAVQAMACARETALPEARINRGGGALARGHPIGASGAVLLTRLFHELDRGEMGLAAVASAGGLGTAVVVRRLG